jgi:hypothetical protein
MRRATRSIACVLLALAALAGASCIEEGIGSTVPSSGARWSGPGDGPDVLVGGGPVYR